METTLGITDKNVEKLSQLGWLSYSSKTGVKLTDAGRAKARETMKAILELDFEKDAGEFEKSHIRITLLYLTHEVEPQLCPMED